MNRFVVVVAANGSLAPSATAYLDAADVDELPFCPERHTRWSHESGTVHFAGWEHGGERRTEIDHTGLVAIAGTPRPRCGVWPAGRGVVEVVRDEIERPGWSPVEELCDAHAIVRVDHEGRGFVVMDPMGFHPLYVATEGNLTVIGNRPDLVAEVVARGAGRPARRDLSAGAWMAFAGYHAGDMTGFEGVRALPTGTTVLIDAGRATMSRSPALFEHRGDPAPVDHEQVAEELYADMVDGFRHAIARSHGRPHVELTGGKDSRLILAVALRAGLTDSLRFVTFGAPELPDMQVATAIAERLRLEHLDTTDSHYLGAVGYSTPERFRRHVHRTCGASQCGDANEPPPHPEWVVSGHVGELFRTASRREAQHHPTSWEEAAEGFVVSRRFGRAGLVRPDLAESLRAKAADFYLEARDRVRSPVDLAPAYIVRCRYARWQGPLIDHHEHVVQPLCSPGAVRSALGMRLEARDLELVHHHLIAAASPELAALPFANDAWRGDDMPSSEPVTGAKTAKQFRPPDAGRRSRELLEVLDADPRNPLLDVLDPTGARAAIERVGELGALERMQVLGMISALIWVGRTESASRHPPP